MNAEKEKEKALWRLQKLLELKAELKENSKLKELLPHPYPGAYDDFIDDYAKEKVNWIDWGPVMKEWVEAQDLRWIEDATSRLEEIQQKKLFDFQCLWRAEKATHPHVKLTDDFRHWEENIFNCPFITPVSQEDVDIYIQYMRSTNFEAEAGGWFDDWQDYDEIKEAHETENANRNFPEWYDFHNSRTGLSAYLLLPDIRRQKEGFYMKLWRNSMDEKRKKEKQKTNEKLKQDTVEEVKASAANEIKPAETAVKEEDKRPNIDYHKKGFLSWFINTFEDKKTQEMFFKYGGERSSGDYDDFLQSDLNMLEESGEIIPIEGWYDWKEAIHKAAIKYRVLKITEAFPEAFDQYQMRLETGIPFETDAEPINYSDGYGKCILIGRKLNGEPENFDF